MDTDKHGNVILSGAKNLMKSTRPFANAQGDSFAVICENLCPMILFLCASVSQWFNHFFVLFAAVNFFSCFL